MSISRERTAHAIEHEFVTLCRSTFGDALESVIVYGSFLRETFRPGSSDVNVLVVVKEGHEPSLRELGRAGRRHMRKYRITPLVLTHREFMGSADVFPMEYFDIVQTHKALHGPDVAGDVTISRSNLRHEIEHQLRGNLIALRQLAVAVGHRRPFRKVLLRRRLEEWSGSISAILRAILRLHDVTPIPENPEELVRSTNQVLGLDPGPIMQLVSRRIGDYPDTVLLLDALLERLRKLVEIVDVHHEPGAVERT
jgi:predicted nucleotidyltransferase